MKSKTNILIDKLTLDELTCLGDNLGNVHDAMDEFVKETVIDILNWVTSEKSEYSIMYGDQPERFSTFKKDYTSEELFELYLESKQKQ